jgi:effector-binding domain-containing protein
MEINDVVLGERQIIAIRKTVHDPGLLFDEALPKLFDFAASNDVEVDGPPLGIYYRVEEGEFDMAVALPVAAAPAGGGEIAAASLPAGPAMTADYVGHYEGLSAAWAEFRHAIDDAGKKPRAEGWEEYVVGPESGLGPDEFQTTLLQTIE